MGAGLGESGRLVSTVAFESGEPAWCVSSAEVGEGGREDGEYVCLVGEVCWDIVDLLLKTVGRRSRRLVAE